MLKILKFQKEGDKMKILFILGLTLINFACAHSLEPKKRILMMVSEGFYGPEYYVPLHLFKNKGFLIKIAAKYKRATHPDERHRRSYSDVIPDLTFDKVDFNDFDAIVFAGGNGAWEDFFPNKDVHKLLKEFMENDKVVGLLCSSTGLLGVANNLTGRGYPLAVGRHVTGYKRVEGLLINLGKVNYSKGIEGEPYVVVDKNLITGRDPISSELFALKIIEKMGVPHGSL